MQKLRTRETDWESKEVKVTLNVRTEACIVPSDNSSARLTYGHVVVLDDFICESLRKELFQLITSPHWKEEQQNPPSETWKRETCDQAGDPPSWGLKGSQLAELVSSPPAALIEVQSRLCKLYPEADIFHMPSELIQPVRDAEESDVTTSEEFPGYDCDKFVANAAVYGDCFQWHVDADPWTIDDHSKWAQQYGTYFNGEPGKPLFVSLLLYLNSDWQREWDAETLFLDSHTDTGFFAGRAVLMDQDVLHRLSTPSQKARRPRYSLVWKLVFQPKREGDVIHLCRKEWASPTYFGSAAKAKAVQDALF